jgi:hypothetical protein
MTDPWSAQGMPRSAAARTAFFVARQPSWVLKAALIAAMVVGTALAMALIVPALIVGVLVLLAAGLIARVRLALSRVRGGSLTRTDGRRNVRVVVRHDGPA